MVPRVDFISATGGSPPNVYRPGGPYKMVTGLGVLGFDRERRRFGLESIHPGHSLEEILANTGFELTARSRLLTPPPEPHILELLRTRIRDEVAEVYPRFAAGFTG